VERCQPQQSRCFDDARIAQKLSEEATNRGWRGRIRRAQIHEENAYTRRLAMGEIGGADVLRHLVNAVRKGS
jgi:hypothetical protein